MSYIYNISLTGAIACRTRSFIFDDLGAFCWWYTCAFTLVRFWMHGFYFIWVFLSAFLLKDTHSTAGQFWHGKLDCRLPFTQSIPGTAKVSIDIHVSFSKTVNLDLPPHFLQSWVHILALITNVIIILEGKPHSKAKMQQTKKTGRQVEGV